MLDALLKEICAALLESDVNVKLVQSLRQKVKAKAKAYFESGADRGKEGNRKNVVQKVGYHLHLCSSQLYLRQVRMVGYLRRTSTAR